MRKLKLKRKKGLPFISNSGSNHPDAVLVVSKVVNEIIDKRLQIVLTVFNSIDDLNKKSLDLGKSLNFDENNFAETKFDEEGNVESWGVPKYSEVLALFNIVDDGIVIISPQAEAWLLNGVEFKNEALNQNWEFIK